MAIKKFRGKDRRILERLLTLIRRVEVRDTLCVTHPTSKRLSTTAQMIPAIDTALVAHWNAVKVQLSAKYIENR